MLVGENLDLHMPWPLYEFLDINLTVPESGISF